MIAYLLFLVLTVLSVIGYRQLKKVLGKVDANWQEYLLKNPDLAAKHRNIVISSIFLFILFYPLSVFLCYFILGSIYDFYRNLIGEGTHIFAIGKLNVLIGGIFIAIAFASVLVFLYFKLRYKNEFKAVVASYNDMYFFNAFKTVMILSVLSYAIGFVATFFVISPYAVLKDDIISVKSALDFEPKEYRLNDISAIYYVTHKRVPNGDIIDKPYYVLEFIDRKYISSRTKWRQADVKDFETAAFLAKISSKSIETIKLYNE